MKTSSLFLGAIFSLFTSSLFAATDNLTLTCIVTPRIGAPVHDLGEIIISMSNGQASMILSKPILGIPAGAYKVDVADMTADPALTTLGFFESNQTSIVIQNTDDYEQAVLALYAAKTRNLKGEIVNVFSLWITQNNRDVDLSSRVLLNELLECRSVGF